MLDKMIPCALYEGELWDVSQLMDEHHHYKNEDRLRMKEKSQARAFFCPDCGQNLVLCAGPKIPPYFRHYQEEACSRDLAEKGQNYLLIRSMLVRLARKSYPEAWITMGQAGKIGRLDLVICQNDYRLGVKYLASEQPIEEWRRMHSSYLEEEDSVIYVLSARHFNQSYFTNFEYLIAKECGYCLAMDYHKELIYIAQAYRNPITGSDSCYREAYPIEEASLDEEEAMCQNFLQHFEEHLQGLEDEQERRRLIRQKQEQERLDRERRHQQWEASHRGEVRRVVMQQEETDCRIAMPVIDETWILPELTLANERNLTSGRKLLKSGYAGRRDWMRMMNHQIRIAPSDEKRDQIIRRMIEELQENTLAIRWT